MVTATVPLAFFTYFVIGGGIIRADLVEGTAVMAYMRAIVIPPLEAVAAALTFRTVVQGWNLLLPVLGIAALVTRRFVHLPFEVAEDWARDRLARATRVIPTSAPPVKVEAVASRRLSMLREYSETKKLLFQEKRRLAFLSVDVLAESRPKAGEDRLVVEHAFAEYRKFVTRILSDNHAWKTTWQADRVLGAFFTIDAAVRAGQDILVQLPWFNDGVHQLRRRIEVQAGVTGGEVVLPDDKKLEDLSDEVVQLTSELARRAPAGSLWLTRVALAEVAKPDDFCAVAERVSNLDVCQWRPGERPIGEVERSQPG